MRDAFDMGIEDMPEIHQYTVTQSINRSVSREEMMIGGKKVMEVKILNTIFFNELEFLALKGKSQRVREAAARRLDSEVLQAFNTVGIDQHGDDDGPADVYMRIFIEAVSEDSDGSLAPLETE